MTKEHLYIPLGSEHNTLTKIQSGVRNIVIDLERVKDFVEEGDTPESFAQDMYAQDVKAISTAKSCLKYSQVEEPAIDPNISLWVVRKTLTEDGTRALKALEDGLVWNSERHEIDYEETKKLYTSMMEKGRIEIRFVNLLCENKDPELRDLVAKIIYFKMQGQINDREITNFAA